MIRFGFRISALGDVEVHVHVTRACGSNLGPEQVSITDDATEGAFPARLRPEVPVSGDARAILCSYLPVLTSMPPAVRRSLFSIADS